MKHPEQEEEFKFDNMSREDLKKIEKSMKNPEFMGLLNEYMVEISDPKNKNEYDEYLRQLEREKELPKHMKIAEIKPKFCFRTFLVAQKNKKHEMKFFINMCESEYLEKPGCQPHTMEDGAVGYSWKVPNSMGKIRYDQDKHGNPCQVVDIAFHPDTYFFAAKKEFQEMMINIALEAAERQLGERKETLSRDYVILKNLKCKGHDGKPALMPIRYIGGKAYNKGEGPNNQPERDLDGKETKLQRDINKQKDEYTKEQAEKKAKEEAERKAKQEEEKQQELEDRPKLVEDLEQGVQRPKYTTIFTYPVDYAEFIDSPYTKRRTVPTVFNIEFKIPRVESMEQVAGQQLQINDRKIVLKIGDKYFIDLEIEELKLKYTLVTSNAKAKYDKKKKSLRIVIPVDQTVKYEPQVVEEEVKETQDQKVVEDETWKNKVLDFTEPSVTVKMLESKEQEQEQSKLVEQIDEEDVIEEAQSAKIVQEEQQIQEQYSKPTQKTFTVSNYYTKPKKEPQSGESRRIGHLFQQTSDKVVLVIQMKNYKKEDVRFLNITNQEFLILWDQSSRGEKIMFKWEHLKLNESVHSKIDKVQAVFRVGFVAIMINKKVEEKGKFWQKQIVQQLWLEGQTQEEQLNQFESYFLEKEEQERKLTQNALREEQARKAIEKQAQDKKQIMQAIEQTTEKTNVITETQVQPESKPKVQQKKVQALTVRPDSLFKNLQPQFINFSASFVYALD